MEHRLCLCGGEMTRAEKLNTYLARKDRENFVQITTYAKSWIYTRKHTGWFTMGRDGCLYIRTGHRKNCLTSPNGGDLVSIRTGYYRNTKVTA